MGKRTKIVATLGPTSNTMETICELIDNGANVFRLNFSHGTHEVHAALINLIHEATKKLNRHIGILGDLCGPKIRVGKFANGSVVLKEGQTFTLSQDQGVIGGEKHVSTSYQYLVKDVVIDSTIFLDDGNIALKAIGKGPDWVSFIVTQGGTLKDNKGMNIPGIKLSVETITEKDKADLRFIIEQKLDFVALSFVRSGNDLVELRKLIGEAPIRVVAKIEKPEAVDDLEAILGLTDAVMIARGDLGVEVPIEQVPAIQKHILERCYRRGILAITATQMLESMIANQRPTRAETTDVFNAILDGTDAVMLSGETAVGKYPVAAVKMMLAIATEAEKVLSQHTTSDHILPEVKHEVEDIVAHAACEAAENAGSRAIIAFTNSGNTARNISKYHPSVPVFALSPFDNVCRRLSLSWGVEPILSADLRNTDEMFTVAERTMKEQHLVKTGDVIVIVAGVPFGVKGNTNMMKLHKVS